MDYRIGAFYPVEALFEISVDINGNNYLVIYGRHINGGFCCIPNWNIACEMGDSTEIFYNSEALQRCKLAKTYAKAISKAIRNAASVRN